MNRLERFQVEILDDVEIIQLDNSLRTVALRQFSKFIESIEQGAVYDALFSLKTAYFSARSGDSSEAMNRISERLEDVFGFPPEVMDSIAGMAHLSILMTVHPAMKLESYLDRNTLFLTNHEDYRVYAMTAQIIVDNPKMVVDFVDVNQDMVTQVDLIALNSDAREFSRGVVYADVGDALWSVLWGDRELWSSVEHVVKPNQP